MIPSRKGIRSIAERTRPVQAGAPIVAAHFADAAAVFVLGEEALLWVEQDGEPRRTAIHAGAILASAATAESIVTAGDDGKVVATRADGQSATIAHDDRGRWIDCLAAGPNGALAWSAGKQAFARGRDDAIRTTDAPSTVGGLAFAPKGFRLGIAHYNGVTLWFPNLQVEPQTLEWKGSHLGVIFSPDGRFAVSLTQEAGLHSWRLVDGQNMRMSGYEARVRSTSWSTGGKWLATSGATQLVLWPFGAKDGPMGKAPRLLAATEQRVEVVACHPELDVAAAGYADGLVLLVRIEDGAEILAKTSGDSPITALAWSAAGDILIFGTEDGAAGIIQMP
jgi:WD40 repeat protein